MSAVQSMSIQVCGELAATALALLLAFVCRWAELSTRRGAGAAATTPPKDERIDDSSLVGLGRP